MLSMKVEMVDTDKVLNALKKFDDDLQIAITKFFKAEGADMEREIKMSMSTSGRHAGIGPRGGEIRAHSKPGQVPFTQSVQLRNSIGYLVHTTINSIFLDMGAIRGGNELNYAEGLEVGTSNMAARPWLMPVVKKHLDTWEQLMGIKVRAIVK